MIFGSLSLDRGHGLMFKSNEQRRLLSTSTPLLQSISAPSGSAEEPETSSERVNPFKLAENDLNNLYKDIQTELWTERPELEQIARYYFDGQGKAFRPMIVVLIARALNYHMTQKPDLLNKQKTVAMVTEMIHTASLVHDDVIDTADTRRGKPSVNVLWGQKKAILAGDYILSRASQMLAKLRDDEVILILSQVHIPFCRRRSLIPPSEISSSNQIFPLFYLLHHTGFTRPGSGRIHANGQQRR